MIFMALPPFSRWRHFVFWLSVCAYVCTESLIGHLTNRLWDFHQIYNFGAVGVKDELTTLAVGGLA